MELLILHKPLSDKPKCRCQGEPTGQVYQDGQGNYWHEFMCITHGTSWTVKENQLDCRSNPLNFRLAS